MSIGDNIRKRRFALRLSQQELAVAMGYKSRSTIAKIESGENDVSHKKLQKFAAGLDTTGEELIAGYAGGAPSTSVVTLTDVKRHKHVAIILAGGKSGQNRQNIPSQFVNVHGKPIIVYCMEAYQVHPAIDDIYVVCLKGWESIVKAYADQYGITKLRGLIPGGTSGMSSLKNAIDYVRTRYTGEDMIIIQESTRPLISAETVSNLLQACSDKGSATICHSMREYVQFSMSGTRAEYIDRSTTIALQSPEAHRLSLLREVFDRAADQQHPLGETCCAMLLYNLGYDINFIESNVNNIKISRDEDIAAFSAMVEH